MQVTTVIVKIIEKPWERISMNGQPHDHGLKLGSERHTTEVILQKNAFLHLTSGVVIAEDDTMGNSVAFVRSRTIGANIEVVLILREHDEMGGVLNSNWFDNWYMKEKGFPFFFSFLKDESQRRKLVK
ncbi:hypothetical protein M8C21_024361 [Ambrosia artemisiifolia]|uniref:factor independent urate hydroxylase n=1 Tax=Ambrosia artemisiifolia TaxID=4212 RepID=A0AAD5CZB1_AMBAR|nr:hypothetical protein M8C21_024361 [Ambrosia artemisiifolia]